MSMQSALAPMSRERSFTWPVRVYYEDTDAAGIVYHANYLRFMERGRTEWLRELGYEQDALSRDRNIVFVVTRSDLRYLRATRYNEELRVVTALERLRAASFEMAQEIDDVCGKVVCRGRIGVACVEAQSLRPARIPADLWRVFEGAY